ncbi:hypothetical protein Salat_1534300 [Sesamum alatum]|uniref:PWWP domain-containing protein n=1 Tax=Sesamum alatum TaxID=300844 RepID=A0AAE2CMI9_9LAMI|nr:hypothetical protein Salat_1534300 [Sesamum alatum]
MISVMSTTDDGGVGLPLVAVGDVALTGAVGSAAGLGLSTVGPAEEAARVSLAGGDGSNETRISGNANDRHVCRRENEENRFGDVSGGENKRSSSGLRVQGNGKKAGPRNGKPERKTNRSMMVVYKSILSDYDSILSAFDEFAAKVKRETVGHGYKIGDMVWGKVNSHPWWPGHIYNEALASPSVRTTKHEGHALVAFFGDSSYGWFNPAELIPFEENFEEKSKQTTSKPFLEAVEEAVDELSRRRSLGLACRCRNAFNFSPSSVDGYFVVDVGDNEPGIYGWSQINGARDSFRPREMLSFVQRLALNPMNDQHSTIDFIKNKATVLACRKALFERVDETYAQAFGTASVRPKPSAPVTVDPSKAPLRGRLVVAEALGKGKISLQPTKTKDQVEKEKSLFKGRDESIQKSKKASSGQLVPSSHQLLAVDGLGSAKKVMYPSTRHHMYHASEYGTPDGQHQPKSFQASMPIDTRPSEGSRKHVKGAMKKTTVKKRPAVELNAVNANVVGKNKKRKKTNTETGDKLGQFSVAVSNSAVERENVSGSPLHVPRIDNNGMDNHKKDLILGSLSSQSQSAVDFGKMELQMLVRDLHALALNPFHGEGRSCPAVIIDVFSKFRSLVYQKSLLLSPPVETHASEGNSNALSDAALVGPADKTKKIVKPSVRLDDPTKGGKKRGPPDHPGNVKKKKLGVQEEIKKTRKVNDTGNTNKKKIDDSRLLVGEKRTVQRSNESQRGRVGEKGARIVPPMLTEAVRVEPCKRMEQAVRVVNPTMLVMKYPPDAALPSGSHLRAKFARFGPLDHTATRVFWKTNTCRLVFLHKDDAESALEYTHRSNNAFGRTHLKSYIREREVDAAESEPVTLQKETVSFGASYLRDSAVEQRMDPIIAAQPLQAVQLKSCLKKPSGDEGGIGSGKGAKVKFLLGGGGQSNNSELLSFQNKINTVASIPELASSINSLDVGNKISPKFIPQTNIFAPSMPFPKFPANMASFEQGLTPFNGPPTQQMSSAPDISQQMLNLLNKCHDMVHTLTRVFGYAPYRPI